ncbi:aminoglycoside 3'-phosphotransferase [Nocardia cyriacigeorgica]|uniref:aminoglycoside 3'-phosphotransferase n=1 Tax=Nocardia cyriacigeorgica TaxID=135487 RepID=UPI0018963D5A|nr:aminoglycoside 3'-phosphotransferase [Nocardia cyriacigeorgica]MBF6453920.1 aminoglycoside 3'-phosphotransferase [Nocardia cyriacigeorgica]MBF6481287.1 aminoglycoside 3'-phosphotransferase [Nocardia cyriacigeorgica]MBF6551814.1 aminoglycoside 3'-phosphotransferase [Nocardia cyriacigeorgica]
MSAAPAGWEAPLPPTIAALLGDSPDWSDAHEGMSGGVVFAAGYWVKRGQEAVAEYERLRWLAGRGIPVPEVAAFDEDVLVLADVGVPSLARRGGRVGAVMGEALRVLHQVPVADCPFDGRLEVMVPKARRRVSEGLVDAEDFDDDHPLTPEQVLRRLIDEQPEDEDLVVAHGDFTPANVLEGGILIDVGALGVADRHRDLALAARDLREDFGDAEVAEFFAAYGLVEPDQRTLDYYRLLDELF